MVTPTLPGNQDRIWRKILSVLQGISNTAVQPVGNAIAGRLRRKVWLSAGVPATAATGQIAGDFVLDTTNNEVYRFISSNTFVQVTTDA